MGLKNLFNRKTKNNKRDNTSGKSIVHERNNTSPEVVSQEDSTREELEHVFKKFDVNGDGKISASELGSIMESLSHRPTTEELEIMITEVDGDGDGFIDLKEFIELNTKGIDSVELLENLKEAFSVFDIDNSGLIIAEELHKVLSCLGEECTVDECKKMIFAVDQDGDGMISFDEFKVMMINGSRFAAIKS